MLSSFQCQQDTAPAKGSHSLSRLSLCAEHAELCIVCCNAVLQNPLGFISGIGSNLSCLPGWTPASILHTVSDRDSARSWTAQNGRTLSLSS